MQFKLRMCGAIADKAKTETRRLVKENQKIEYFPDGRIKKVLEKDKKGKWRTKWKVGQDYAVQAGRGKKGLSYCLKCRTPHNHTRVYCKDCLAFSIPLRIKILEIRKEKLLDISQEDAIAEGFEDKDEFLAYFYEINKNNSNAKKSLKKWFDSKIENATGWNPLVWVLKFKVKE